MNLVSEKVDDLLEQLELQADVGTVGKVEAVVEERRKGVAQCTN